MGPLYSVFVTIWNGLAQATPTEPGASLPWYTVVGTGLFVALGCYTLLFVMLKVFPRGRRHHGRKPQEPVYPKNAVPKEDWPPI
jgi:hypothetical protein